MSGALPKLYYQDPLVVLLNKEGRTCKGCRHEHHDKAFGREIVVCTKIDKDGMKRRHGRRCRDYIE